MNIEDTKCVEIISDAQKVNKLIKLGWTPIGINKDDDGQIISFVLAWQQIEYLPPKFLPEEEIYKELK